MDGKKYKTTEHSGDIEIKKLYHKNGQVWSIDRYKKDKRHGVSQKFSKEGKLTWEKHWKDGKAHGTWKQWYDGVLFFNRTYKNGAQIK